MANGDPATPPAAGQAPPSRLESWKEIAVYLKRDVTTVRRWEKSEGLPAHRHQHSRQASVYAFPEELDEWRRQRSVRAEAEPERQPPARLRPALVLRAAAAALGLLVLAVFLYGFLYGLYGAWSRPVPSLLGFQERDLVLVAAFDNRTGETVLDGTLEHALARELANSRFVNVVPGERIEDVLALMRQPAGRRLDPDLAREVALRDGGIRALVTGRVDKLDGTYLLSASLVSAGTGVAVASFSEEADGQPHLVAAVRRLAARVREAAGESLAQIQATTATLEKVTTPSLRALQLYSEAMTLAHEQRWPQAIELLGQAVAADPQFASAHILLAHSLSNVNRHDEAIAHYDAAYRLADSSSDRERYFIAGSYYSRRAGDGARAIQQYELLVRLYPDHYWGLNNLTMHYRQAGRMEEAERLSVRRAELRPHDFATVVDAAQALVISQSDPEVTAHYVERARQLLSPETARRAPQQAAWVQTLPIYQHWLAGRVDEALAEADRLAATLVEPWEPFQNPLRTSLAGAYIAMGRPAAAERVRAWPYEVGLTVASWLRGQPEVARQHAREPRLPSYLLAHLLVRFGLPDEAERMLVDPRIEQSVTGPPAAARFGRAIRAEILLGRGHVDEALPMLEAAVRDLKSLANEHFFLAAVALADVFESRGEPERALAVLEDAARVRHRMFTFLRYLWPAWMWMHVEARRAELYRTLGRHEEAATVDAQLGALLAAADAEFRLPASPPHAAR
ncbi:MAG: tetratricopeptide repeat protein [Acidobacteriota bacterium]|nr:tetratricopeptide repeat protein [Acidobacteriota bacterium]